MGVAALLAQVVAAAAAGRRPVVLLRSGWQTVNIGDIAHTPGVLRLLQRHVPEAEVLLWPVSVGDGVEEMLRAAFPAVAMVKGRTDEAGQPTTDELAAAFERADFLLHGSGPSVVARAQLEAWRKATGKLYGIYGVTIEGIDQGLHELLDGAAFVFCRETKSLANLQRAGVSCPMQEFAPDGAFACDLLDEPKAEAFLAAHGLADAPFLCAIPRLRYTPYHKFRRVTWSADEIRRRETENAQHAEPDHAKLREAITAWVRRTGLKVLVCPEMTYQLEIGGPLVVDPLPDDVKTQVVKRESFWLTDEATAVYRHAAAVVSFECHSPILAIGQGTPACYLRQPTDTIKGWMWHDVGLEDWIFEIEEVEGATIAAGLLGIHDEPEAAKAKVEAAHALVRRRQAETMGTVRGAIGLR